MYSKYGDMGRQEILADVQILPEVFLIADIDL